MIQKKTKKTLTILLSLLLAATMAACALVSEPENTVPSASTQTPEPGQTAEPEKTSEPANPLHSGILRASNEEIVSSVQVHHVAEDSFAQAELAPYKVVDLGELEFYHEYVDSYQEIAGLSDVSTRIIFMTDTPVKDFRYLEIETISEETLGIVAVDTLYQLDVLTPEEPFVVNWLSIGDVGMYRGISFVEEDGATRYFGFNTSGYDGDMVLIEFKPE